MILHKFGGTSIQDAQGFLAVSEIIREQLTLSVNASKPGLVILSAISGVNTRIVRAGRHAALNEESACRDILSSLRDQHLSIVENLPMGKAQNRILCEGIKELLHQLDSMYRSITILGELTRRGKDTISAFGPMLSVHILADLLQEQGIRAQAVNTTEVLILDTTSGEPVPLIAPIRTAAQQHLVPLLAEGKIPILTASIGSTPEGIPAMLDRGGGDTSAAALAAALGADECWIWTDVDGILTADPALVSDALTLPELSYEQAAELARFGVDVLHPDTLLPGINAGFQLRIRSSFHPARPGTRISHSSLQKTTHLPSILSMTGLCLITVQGSENLWSLRSVSRILESLHHSGIEIPMFSQQMSAHDLILILRDRDKDYAIKSVQQSLGSSDRSSLSFESDVDAAIITAVVPYQANIKEKESLFSKMFFTLGELRIPVYATARSSSGNSLSLCIPSENCRELVARLHRRLVKE